MMLILKSRLLTLSRHSLSRFCSNITVDKNLPVLTLFTKDDCQLCDEALEKLSPFLADVKLETVDIEEDGREADYDKYRYEIPVFYFNKKFLCKNKIDLDKFHAAMENYRN